LPDGAGKRSGGDGPIRVGVLAVQGGFAAHLKHLGSVGALGVGVRTPADLDGLDGLILPGGESTTISMGIERAGLADGIVALSREGRPVLGTCAGMIVADRDHLGLIDISTKRNAFGRQLASFEDDLTIAGVDGPPFRCVFIRAPWVERSGEGVEVLAEVRGHPVAVRQGSVTAVSFHPELTADDRIHEAFAAVCRSVAERRAGEREEPDHQ
jgi:pyridoxal 5'-phosphate synthase pdxT subunit